MTAGGWFRACWQSIRLLPIWDSFWTVRSVPDPGGLTPPLDEEGCRERPDFLETLAGRGRSAVLIASRASEDWLGGIRRIAVGGLASHEVTGCAGNSWCPARRRSGRGRARRVRRRTALEVRCPRAGGHLGQLPGGPAHVASRTRRTGPW